MMREADKAAAEFGGYTLVKQCHGAAMQSGWWINLKTGVPFTPQERHDMVPTKLMLTVSELSEAMEGHRKGLMDSHLPNRTNFEVELADAAIRIFDLAGGLNIDLGKVIAEKLAYNAMRADHKLSARMQDGGKRY